MKRVKDYGQRKGLKKGARKIKGVRVVRDFGWRTGLKKSRGKKKKK